MNGLRKRKKLKTFNFLRQFTQAVRTSSLILFTHVKAVKFTPVRT